MFAVKTRVAERRQSGVRTSESGHHCSRTSMTREEIQRSHTIDGWFLARDDSGCSKAPPPPHAVRKVMSSALRATIMTVSYTAASAVMVPLTVISCLKDFDNEWVMCKERAKLAGQAIREEWAD